MIDRLAQATNLVLEVSRLAIRFRKVEVFSELSFEVRKESSLAIIGPNGAGKTVLFQALIGSIPSEGTIQWASGVRIGYVPQKLDIERDVPITGMDFLRARSRRTQVSNAEIAHILDLVGVSREVSNNAIGTLSGGQFQRLLLAFALLGKPSVLMLDEPTAGVDEPGQRQLNELIHCLQKERGLTVLFISHELAVVRQYATDVLCLGHGKASIGAPGKILTQDLLSQVYGTPLTQVVHDD